MNAALVTAYRKARKDNRTTARNALAIARSDIAKRDLPYFVKDGTEFSHKRFNVRISVKPDDDVDISWLGEFTDSPAGFSFDRKHGGQWDGPNSYRYFEPAADNGRSVEAYRKAYSELGYSRHDADCNARRDLRSDWKLAEELNESGMFGVIVKVSRNDIELGSASIWSIDPSYIEGAYLDYDLLGEAIAEARKALKALCPRSRNRKAV